MFSLCAPARTLVLVAATLCMLSPTAGAGESTPDPPDSHREWGLGFKVRAGDAGSDYGDFLQKGTAWDLDIFRQKSDWRYGLGLNLGSLGWQPPYDHQQEWAHFETYGYAARVFRNDESIRPYLQGRLSIVRMHPRANLEDSLFTKKPIDELEPGESPTDAVNGVGLSLVPGVEFDVARGLAVDVSAYVNWYVTKKYTLADYEGVRRVPYDDPSKGLEWGARVGATWRPISFDPPARTTATPDTTPLKSANRFKDAWGAMRSPGWASAEVLGINFGASMFNEYVRQANFNQISPRSFWDNMEEGFTYDDNKFKTNQMIHPFNGSTYYNSGRANGLSFWPSSFFAVAGAFIWEAAGETHPMSFNDMMSTGVGGIAFGEATYRLSSAVLDNTSTGSGRTWREIGGFLIDPVRGFNRFLSGRATRVQGNPSSPYDHRPPRYFTTLSAGARIIGKGESIKDSTQTQAVLDLYINHGSAWENERRKPYDHMDIGVQMNGSDKVPIGRFQIRGDLYSRLLGDRKQRKYAFAISQYFDYVNNNAFEFGGQSIGATLYSRFRPSPSLGINTRVDALWNMMAAINSEYSFLAVVANQERFREYDYGTGAGFIAEATSTYKGKPLLGLGYRFQYINVKNGSIWDPSQPGSNANHYVQSVVARLYIPIRGPMSFEMDGAVFLRDSHYQLVQIEDIRQRIPQLRFTLAWYTSR